MGKDKTSPCDLLFIHKNIYLIFVIYDENSCLYGICQRASGILRITPANVIRERLQKNADEIETDQLDIIYCGDDMVHIKDKFEGGVMDLEGNIYCIPMQAKALIKIIPGPRLM